MRRGSSRSASPRGCVRCSFRCICHLQFSGVWERLRMQPALRRIESAVADVAQVDVAEQRVGLAHPLQGRHRCRPRTRRSAQCPTSRQAETEAEAHQDRDQDQFAIAAQHRFGRFDGLVNDNFPRSVRVISLPTPQRQRRRMRWPTWAPRTRARKRPGRSCRRAGRTR